MLTFRVKKRLFVFNFKVTQHIFFAKGAIAVSHIRKEDCDGPSQNVPTSDAVKMQHFVIAVVTSYPWRSFECCRDCSKEKSSARRLRLRPWRQIISKRIRKKKTCVCQSFEWFWSVVWWSVLLHIVHKQEVYSSSFASKLAMVFFFKLLLFFNLLPPENPLFFFFLRKWLLVD